MTIAMEGGMVADMEATMMDGIVAGVEVVVDLEGAVILVALVVVAVVLAVAEMLA